MSSTITIGSNGKSMSAEVYTPTGSARRGYLVVAYGSDGLEDNENGPWKTMITGYAAALAKKGLTAVIPDYLGRTGTQPGLAALEMIGRHRGDWEQALIDAIDHGKYLPLVDPMRVGLLGFSLGGYLSLRVRARANVLVSFFAPMLEGIGTGGSLSHAQIHHGEADRVPGTGFANAGEIAQVLKIEGTQTEVFGYPGAGHGFARNDRANTDARDQSMNRTLAFFEAHL